jgi:hypothetical protein
MHRHNSLGTSSQANRVADHLKEGYDAATECVADHPASSILVVFGVGCGLGLLLGHALAEPPRDERHHWAAVGRHMLEAMRGYMPDALSKRLPA